MPTIFQIKTQNQDNLRDAVLPGSITKEIDATMRDVVANELRDRGVIVLSSMAALATTSKDNTRIVLVREVGFFTALATLAAADEETTFVSADVGWLWLKSISVEGSYRDRFTVDEDFEYELADGYKIDEICMKSSVAENRKIGLTDGGDEVMMEDPVGEDVWYSVTKKVFADGGDVTLYFRLISASTVIIIYSSKL